jgi:hypothetical protein
MGYLRLTIPLLVLFAASAATAASSPVALPKSEIPWQRSSAENNSVSTSGPSLLSVELLVSSWAPRSANIQSWREAPDFTRSAVPYLQVGYALPIRETLDKSLPITIRAGIGFMRLSRAESLDFGVYSQQAEQSLYVTTLRLEADISSAMLNWKHFSPYLGLIAMPTLALAGQTAISRGTTDAGVPVGLALGANIRAFGADLAPAMFASFRSAGDIDLSGAGAEVALRL